MVVLPLLPGIEQRHYLSPGIPIDRTEVAAFIAVAPITTEAKIVDDCFPAMLFCNDMIDSKVDGAVCFPNEAVFAAMLGTFDHFPAERSKNIRFTQLSVLFQFEPCFGFDERQ